MKWLSRKLLAALAAIVGIGTTQGQTDPGGAAENTLWVAVAYIVAQAVQDVVAEIKKHKPV